jgi:hypothetical protein
MGCIPRTRMVMLDQRRPKFQTGEKEGHGIDVGWKETNTRRGRRQVTI